MTLGGFRTTPEINSHINEVLTSGRLSYGPKSVEFEDKFASMHGCKHGVLVNSGTSGLVLALQASKLIYGWSDGDEIIAPALTFVATVNAILHSNLKPILVDIDPLTYNLNADLISEAVTDKTRAIIPVHLFGQPADMGKILTVANVHGLRIIEDSCESVLATHNDKYVGSWGDYGVFSTYVAHHLVTGVGGVVTTNNRGYANYVRSLANHGLSLDYLPSGEVYDPSHLGRNFWFDKVGHSFRVTELEAALGLAQIDDLEETVDQRNFNAGVLYDHLQDLQGYIQLPHIQLQNKPSFMVFPIVMRQGSKHKIMAYLRNKGVECRDMMPLTNQPCYHQFRGQKYPVADNINNRGFYIGCHQYLGLEELDYVNGAIHEFFYKV